MRTTRWIMAVGVAATVLLLALPALSQERDSDGTRMQARQVELGSVHSDRLTPPDDGVDWRMIRLDEQTDVVLRLSVKTEDASAQLKLTGATGEELAVSTAGEEDASIERSLLAGIYYIAVESADSLQYEISLR